MDSPADTTIASLFAAADLGTATAGPALFTALYSELHRLARRELSKQGWGVSLGATSLLHEAYLDLSRRDAATFPDRSRFMAYAARVMRGLIVDYARNRQAQKRGGEFHLTAIGTDAMAVGVDDRELTRVSEALDELAELEPVLAEVVDLKYFCGFSFEEIAVMKGLSDRTVRRHWTKARAYLRRAIRDNPGT